VESGQRSEPGNVCIRALADAEANTDVVEILATCIAEPRNMACDDYAADAGEPFNSKRVELYVSSCAGDEALTNGAQAAFCPEAAVKAELCLGTNGANARPFAPICTQTSVTPNLASTQGLILQICVETTNDNDDRCMHSQANAAVIAVRASCNATTGDPFATARPITATGVTATTFNCSTQNQFETERVTYTAACKTGSVPTVGTCTGDVITRICTKTAGANADPFNGLCDATTHETYRTTFANLCVDATANSGDLDGATCPTAVVNCATNPFGSLCADAGYNGQKAAVLEICKVATATAKTGGNARCLAAFANRDCLKDALGCTDGEANAQFAQAAEGAITYRNTIQQNRVAYCAEEGRVNTQQAICRTTAQGNTDTGNKLYGVCLQNPFSGSCQDEFGGASNQTMIRNNRIAYCRDLSAAEVVKGITSDNPTNVTTVGRGEDGTADARLINLCWVDDNNLAADAMGRLCYGTVLTDKTADPFLRNCLEFNTFDARRKERFEECAGEAGTASGGVFTPASAAAFECTGYTIARINDCNNAANPTARNELKYCPDTQAYAEWNADTTVTKTAFGSVNATENRFLSGLGGASTLPSTLTQTAYTLNPTSANDLPSVRFFSAQTPEVPFVAARDAVAAADAVVVNASNNGQRVELADGTVIPVVDSTHHGMVITAAVAEVTQRDEVPFQAAGPLRFYAGIINSTSLNVGAPLFNRATTSAIWNGEIHWVGSHTATNSTLAKRDFKMKVDYSALTIQGAVPITAGNTTGAHLVIDGTYDGAGIMTGDTNITSYTTTPNTSATVIDIDATSNATVSPGTLSGIIGNKGAVGVFINDNEAHNIDSGRGGYSGGFIVRPPAGNQ
ncbi:MAG: hypothetical protein K8953_07920, partial [Proteobacteria bacterium]|nr:hypothetical protein [Pseudomonadota bacterium]